MSPSGMAEPCLLRLNNGEQSKANCWHCWSKFDRCKEDLAKGTSLEELSYFCLTATSLEHPLMVSLRSLLA